MYYGDERESMVNIALKLKSLGWEIFGYKEDQSDSMTDYYCPARWEGIATKNGYVLCVDIKKYNLSNSGKEVFSYNKATVFNANIQEKIKKLEAITTNRGATKAEEANAKQLIEKIKESAEQQQTQATQQREKSKTLLYKYPEFMANPRACNWHIEKDGKIYGKGKGAFQFSSLPHHYDIATNKYYDSWSRSKEAIPTEEVQKEINKFLTFVHKIDNIAIGTVNMGDGTEETETEGIEAEKRRGYELKTVIEPKTYKKMVEVTDRTEIQEGDFLTLSHHTHFWLVTSVYMRKGTWKVNGENITEERKCFTYERVGSEKRGYQRVKNTTRYYQWEKELLKGLAEGKTKIYELKEVTENIEVEKWVKIDNSKPQTTGEKKTKKESITTESEQTNTKFEHEYTITEDIDTRDNTPLWVMKIADKLSKDEYIKVSNQLKTIGGYYSHFKHGFIFKSNPSELLERLDNGTAKVQRTDKTVDEIEKNREIIEQITDISTDIILDLKLEKMEYVTSELYKNKLAEYLINHNIIITDSLLRSVGFDGLKSVLTQIRTEQEQQKQREQQEKENTKLLDKINKNIDSLQLKIDALSGDYKTNTYKRMNEQASRDSKKESYEIDIKLLNYVKDKLIDNMSITELEKGLITGAFRDTIHSYYIGKYGTCSRPLQFPQVDYNLPMDGWYNKEVPQRQNKLKKYGITNTEQLDKAVDEYKNIYDSIDRYINTTEQKIKQLEREYKMRQKGDINFTPSEVADTMVNYARIDHNSKVLEPSCGIGNIADKIKAITEHIDVCEYDFQFTELLKLKGYNIVGNDFLQYNKFNYYDAIIMNPPFSKNQDITHLQHAYKLLKNNGTLVCITSPHWEFANDRTSQEFREWLEDKTHHVKKLESGTFEMTGVASRIVVIEKNEEVLENVI